MLQELYVREPPLGDGRFRKGFDGKSTKSTAKGPRPQDRLPTAVGSRRSVSPAASAAAYLHRQCEGLAAANVCKQMDTIGRGRAVMHSRKLHDGEAGLAGVQCWSYISSIRVSGPERSRTPVVIPRCEHDVGESLLHPLHHQLCAVMEACRHRHRHSSSSGTERRLSDSKAGRVSKGAENGDVPSVVIGDEIVWLAREGVAV
ncbi:hypothetical protein CABS01_02230 [Colletotrichum abscissum]|uniref:Uncharacterized protein n=1 Tax=Colletotrichum abscissum TaxID=1671311 RepID=A0A9P9XIY1_9PEZI|nr:uncharacterized protein CABS01_02230 [Colletotrichum abscissum]KAI3554421.1 hypothetical protein CABS02_05238 [Colletotrichum abscissum]KAK1488600.1 hypothetical protein CABS01_02230 [Colletotrichum abscissum]